MAYRMILFLVVTLFGAMRTALALSSPEECWQPWYDASSDSSANEQCPYGISLPGGVTLNTDMNVVKNIFNVLYGYMPFAIFIVAGITALISRGTREILFILSVIVCVCLNEFGLKNIIREPKPLGTCANTCGMPSGHSWTSMQYYSLLMVDYAFRLGSTDYSPPVAFPLRMFRLMSTSNVDTISLRELSALGFVWGFLLVPVPFSRVMNFDHTVEQVIIGSASGLASALVAYCIYYILGRTVCRTAWQWPRVEKWYVLKNTIVIPLTVSSVNGGVSSRSCLACLGNEKGPPTSSANEGASSAEAN